MSFKGEIEAKCPKGCEPFAADVWSFIRGDQSPDLRLTVMFRECNLLLCPGCSEAFFPDASYIYFDPQAELLAFVFPEAYRARREFWRKKMHEDFLILKQNLGGELSLAVEPEIFFGNEDVAVMLESEDYRGEECEVMEHYAADLGLSLYRVSPRFARRKGVPGSLPYAGRNGSAATRESVIAGLVKLLAANDRLTAYSEYLSALKKPGAVLPPPSAVKNL